MEAVLGRYEYDEDGGAEEGASATASGVHNSLLRKRTREVYEEIYFGETGAASNENKAKGILELRRR